MGGKYMKKMSILLVVLSFLVSFCSFAFAQEAVVLELWNDKPTFSDWFTKLGEEASKSIGVSVKPVPFADTTTYNAAIRSALASKEAPDLFTWWSGCWLEELVDSGLLEDVTAIWDKYIQSGEVNPDLAAPYTFNGKIYGIPDANDYYVVFYNKKVFAENNLTPPTTWEEFISQCETLKNKGVIPLGCSIQDRWPSIIWFQQLVIGKDPDLYRDLTTGKVAFTDPRIKEIMQVWKDLIDKGYFNDPTIPGVGTTGQSQLAELFRQGKIAMILWGDWYDNFIRTEDFQPGEDYFVFFLPPLNPEAPNAVIFETAPTCIAKNAPNKEASIKFLDWWLSAEGQQIWHQLYPTIPSNLKTTVTNPILEYEIKTVSEGNYQLLTRFWEAIPNAILQPAVDELDRFMLDPSTLDQVLSNIEKVAQEYWASQK